MPLHSYEHPFHMNVASHVCVLALKGELDFLQVTTVNFSLQETSSDTRNRWKNSLQLQELEGTTFQRFMNLRVGAVVLNISDYLNTLSNFSSKLQHSFESVL